MICQIQLQRDLAIKLVEKVIKTAKSGNLCGHNKDKPRKMISINPFQQDGRKVTTDNTGQSRRTMIQYAMIEKVQKFFAKPSLLPMLNAVNGSTRQMRSERREGCILMLESMLYHMDITSLRVGYIIEETNEFVYRKLEFLAEKAGITLSRAERAIKDLKESGILSMKRTWEENEDGSYTGKPSTKQIAKEFLNYLGFEDWLLDESKKAYKRRKEEAEQKATEAANSPKARAYTAMMAKTLSASLVGNESADQEDFGPTNNPIPI